MGATKYIFIILLAFGAYKYISSPIDSDLSSVSVSQTNNVISKPYRFKASFHRKPSIQTRTVSVPIAGRFKLTTYSARESDIACSVAVSDYLDADDMGGGLDDGIAPSKRNALKKLGGTIQDSHYITHNGIKGYEYTLIAKNGMLLKSRLFVKFNNIYNLSCYYQNTTQLSDQVNEFMRLFAFL